MGAVLLEKVPMAMKRAKEVLIVGVIGSWVGQVPLVVLLVKVWRNDLVALYTGCALGYGLVCILLFGIVVRTDWDYYAAAAKYANTHDTDQDEAEQMLQSVTNAEGQRSWVVVEDNKVHMPTSN